MPDVNELHSIELALTNGTTVTTQRVLVHLVQRGKTRCSVVVSDRVSPNECITFNDPQIGEAFSPRTMGDLDAYLATHSELVDQLVLEGGPPPGQLSLARAVEEMTKGKSAAEALAAADEVSRLCELTNISDREAVAKYQA